MSLSISWGSQRILPQIISAMPSLSLRLPRKTCGLFDAGFAGSFPKTASNGVKAPGSAHLPAAPVADDQLLYELGLGEPGQVYTIGGTDPFEDLVFADSLAPSSLYDEKPAEVVPQKLTEKPDHLDTWGLMGGSLGGLETDQLAESSLDAFIDINQLLTGDSFLEETLEPQLETEMKLQAPLISIPTPEVGLSSQQFDFFDLLDTNETEVTPVINFDPTFSLLDATQSQSAATETHKSLPSSYQEPNTSTAVKGGSRKRKSTTKVKAGPCKTSLFEIPISENVVTTTSTEIVPASPNHDHDYSTKNAYPVVTLSFDKELNLTEFVAVEPQPSTSTKVTIKPAKEEVVDKQAIRRQKNNIASKRSREQRKQKISDLDLEAEELIVKNEALRRQIVELEKMAKEMKAALVAKMSGK